MTVVLKGALTGVSGNTLTMTVTGGNRWARAWVTVGTVTVDSSATKVRRNGAKTLADLKPTDWLLVERAATARRRVAAHSARSTPCPRASAAMDIGDIVTYGGKRFSVRGFDPAGVEPRFVYIEDVKTGETISVSLAAPSGTTLGSADLRLVIDEGLS